MADRPRILSFGFKRGDPPEGYVIFDVRRIDNPERDQDLARLTGLDHAVAFRVMEHPLASVFLESAALCIRAGLDVAFGCNQGRHRSVALAQKLADWLDMQAAHRDWSATPHERTR